MPSFPGMSGSPCFFIKDEIVDEENLIGIVLG